jgi:hypothetical protein
LKKVYSVKVTNSSGCSNPDHKVTASNIATIQTIDIADTTDITVTVNVTGSGNYEYSLNPYGPFQSSNLIMFLQEYTEVYVKQKMDVVLSANVLRYLGAKIFHSNGDGYNDYWNVKG